MAGDFDVERPQHQLGQSSGGNARRGLAGRGALQHVAAVGKVVLEGAGQIGMAGTRRGDGLVQRGVAGLDRQFRLPVLPVAVDELDGDGRTDRLAVAHAAEHVGLVGFNLHAAAAAIALLAPPQIAVDEVKINGHTGRQSGDQRNQRLPMRLPGRRKTNHSSLIVTEKRGSGVRDQGSEKTNRRYATSKGTAFQARSTRTNSRH